MFVGARACFHKAKYTLLCVYARRCKKNVKNAPLLLLRPPRPSLTTPLLPRKSCLPTVPPPPPRDQKMSESSHPLLLFLRLREKEGGGEGRERRRYPRGLGGGGGRVEIPGGGLDTVATLKTEKTMQLAARYESQVQDDRRRFQFPRSFLRLSKLISVGDGSVGGWGGGNRRSVP